MNNIASLIDLAVHTGCEVKRNVKLKELTSFKTGGPVEAVITPSSSQALAEVLKACSELNVKVTLLGNGSNVLAPDEGLDGIVIRTVGGLTALRADGCDIFCGAGVPLSRLCLFALENSLSGLEFAYGIPGSAGGAAYMNAGAYDGEMKNVITCCTHIDDSFSEGKLTSSELDYGYRKSAYMKNGYIITGAELHLQKGDQTHIREKMDDLLSRRCSKQPLDFPSAGSTFKRPQGHFAGALIEQCGLKGYCVGNAQVSEKHAGFVINKGNATTKDILSLIKHIQDTVYKETGIKLETEVEILG